MSSSAPRSEAPLLFSCMRESVERCSTGQMRTSVPTWFVVSFSAGAACSGSFRGSGWFVGQHFANLAPEVGGGEGLLDEGHTWNQHIRPDKLAAVSGHVEYFRFRAQRADLFGQSRTIHSGHDDVRDQQINRTFLLVDDA